MKDQFENGSLDPFLSEPYNIITISKIRLQSLKMYQSLQMASDTSGSMQKIQMFLTGRNLLDMDFFSKSDPYVKVYFKSAPNRPISSIGRTQTVMDNLNPNFRTSFQLDFVFQIKQLIRFEVFDEDDVNNQKNDDYIGEAETTLGALTGAKNQTSIIQLKNPKNSKLKCGKLIIRIEPCSDSNQFFQMKWRGKKLMNTDSFFDFWDKSDPYLKFLKIRSDNTYIQVARTQIIKKDLNPNWKPIQIPGGKLFAKDNQSGRFKLEIWDWQQKGETYHQFIGQCFADINQIRSNQKFPMEIPLFNPKSSKPGRIFLETFKPIFRPSFVDFLRGGLELNLSICIDFTASNGIPTHPTSLHYFNQNKPNQYQMAIQAVSRVLLDYDSDKRMPAFGFGAKPRYPNYNSSKVSHCFPLSGDPNQLQAFGLQHLIQLYNQARSSVQLAGPTLFGPLLNQSFKLAYQCAQEGSNTYQILLILTDGEIHDMEATVDLLVDNCNLPLSIIIVGIGNADFTNMIRLDGDNGLFSSKGRRASRDIVQFVPFRDVGLNPDQLARELLAQLPGQVTQYMNLIGKPPGKPLHANMEQMLQSQKPQPQEFSQDILKQQLIAQFQNANFFQQK